MIFPIGFSGNPLDRIGELRGDPAFVARCAQAAGARTVLFVEDCPVLQAQPGSEALFSQTELDGLAPDLLGPESEVILLGQWGPKRPIFARQLNLALAQLDQSPDGLRIPGRPDLTVPNLRTIAAGALAEPGQVALLGQAKSLLHWHAHHRFCSACGTPSNATHGGWRRDCPTCHAQHFPRTDPVVIMLVVDGDKCLIGRQPRFPAGLYSALAGFLEPGETVEEAVRREVREEVGIEIGAVSYVASQPWPFPSSIMIGCFAQAISRDITLDETELEDACWVSRQDVVEMLEGRHPRFIKPQSIAIASHLLRVWCADMTKTEV